MCGIAGIIGDNDTPLVSKMLAALRHRGPDDMGIYADDGLTMGQTRLSIIDVAGGHQPIKGDMGNSFIVANGEIYNYRALAAGLSGHRFSTRTDSEVALHLYEDFGEQMPMMLDGMFAIAVCKDGQTLLARDPLGIKPLYYSEKDGNFYFASEIKALLLATDDVNMFPPGTMYVRGKGFRRFWTLPKSPSREDVSPETCASTIRVLLRQAVEKRLMADVPLGTLLSGGLDSTVVTALAQRSTEKLHTFVTGMEGSSDIEYSLQAAEYLGTEHHEAVFTADDVIRHLPRVIQHLESCDAALVRSALPTYFVSQLARRYVKVVLMGEGADELFAGYQYLKEIPTQALHSELVRITWELCYLNLQRADRMTMAHSLEGRVPFLDARLVRYALSLPSFLKLHGDEKTEKWILRKAFKDSIPDTILNRPKMKFAEGAGLTTVLNRIAEKEITDKEFEREAEKNKNVALRTKEELYIFRLFREFFPQDSVLKVIGRTQVY